MRASASARRDHRLGVAAVIGDPATWPFSQAMKLPRRHGSQYEAAAAEPADADAVADAAKPLDALAEGVDDAGDLVARHAGVVDRHVRPRRSPVGMADAARLDADANVAAAGLGKVAVDELELAAGGGDLDGLHAPRR